MSKPYGGGANPGANGPRHRPPPPGPHSPLAPGGGLQAHDRAGGHTLGKHVGKTDAALRRRLRSQPHIRGSSSFADRAVAERAVADVMHAQAARVTRWLAGTRPTLAIDGGVRYDVGRSLARGAPRPATARRLRIVLQRNPARPAGYHIHTAYPIS